MSGPLFERVPVLGRAMVGLGATLLVVGTAAPVLAAPGNGGGNGTPSANAGAGSNGNSAGNAPATRGNADNTPAASNGNSAGNSNAGHRPADVPANSNANANPGRGNDAPGPNANANANANPGRGNDAPGPNANANANANGPGNDAPRANRPAAGERGRAGDAPGRADADARGRRGDDRGRPASPGRSAAAPGRLPGGGAENNRGQDAGKADDAKDDAKGRGQGASLAPPGSNGHILSKAEGCTINVGFYGFDTGMSTVSIVATEKPPTGRETILYSDSWTANYAPRLRGNTLQDTVSFTLSGEHHLKITAVVVGEDGHATKKTKVEWVRCSSSARATAAPGVAIASSLSSQVLTPLPAVLPTPPVTVAAPVVEARPVLVAAPAVRGISFQNSMSASLAAPGVRVLGTSFERDSAPRAFAFTGVGTSRLLILAGALIFAGGLVLLMLAGERAVRRTAAA